MSTQYENLRAAVVAFVGVEDNIDNLRLLIQGMKAVSKPGDPDAKAGIDLCQLLIDTHPVPNYVKPSAKDALADYIATQFRACALPQNHWIKYSCSFLLAPNGKFRIEDEKVVKS